MNVNLMRQLATDATERETLGDRVLSQIKEILLTGQIMPGDTLSLRATAAALGVSMMPVRQAVYQLVADQALEAMPKRSVRVPVMTAEQFHEITQIRLQVESYAVRQAAGHATPALVQDWRGINQQILAKTDEDGAASLGQIVQLNKSLHFSIYEASGMPMLVKIIESLWLRIGPVLNYDLRSGSGRMAANQHHTLMLDAMAAGDGEAAGAALCQDILTAYRYIIQRHMRHAAHDHSIPALLAEMPENQPVDDLL